MIRASRQHIPKRNKKYLIYVPAFQQTKPTTNHILICNIIQIIIAGILNNTKRIFIFRKKSYCNYVLLTQAVLVKIL